MRRAGSLLVLVLVAGLGMPWQSPASADDEPGSAASAVTRLRQDADGQVRVTLDPAGRLHAVGTATGAEVDNPEVEPRDSVGSAAADHLTRYGDALGLAASVDLVAGDVVRTRSGIDSVRYQQHVDGVPVLGGEVVLGLGRDRELRSLRAQLTETGPVGEAVVAASRATETARALVSRQHQEVPLTVTDLGRTVFDPELLNLDVTGGPRTVRRIEVGDGAGVRELVLVDDATGAVAFRMNLIQELDRIVCDKENTRSQTLTCGATVLVRSETSAPSAVPDVEQAFALTKDVSDFYEQVGDVDLTELLGLEFDDGGRHLASTVRFCPFAQAEPCPYPNAFWSGLQMYYGQGYAAADDVVGHEITHGYIDHRSQLFYWGQSGAINESMADVIGEIVDHRGTGDDDSTWAAGEDLPGGAARSMSDPTSSDQPDRMTSPLWTYDPAGSDNGGVHTNSGVGNKTAYLISQGGTFNGRTVVGIDGADPQLTKTGRLYLDVIDRLQAGATYAHLADALDQSCADLRTSPGSGFTAADCTAVHAAGLATELRTSPPAGAPPSGADVACPAGTVKRVLLDSETGTGTEQTAKFIASTSSGMTAFSRGAASTPVNATSGTGSWFVPDQADAGYAMLRPSGPTSLPAGQPSYLSFQGWNVLDFDSSGYYDGGVVDVNIDNQTNAYRASQGWVNGPTHVLASSTGNSRAGYTAFAGDSRGWVLSRFDLSEWAGHQVTPRFSLFTDDDPPGTNFSLIGWYLDDIQIYTCEPPPGPVLGLTTTGVPRSSATGPVKQRVRWQQPTLNPGSVDGYQVTVDGAVKAVTGPGVLFTDLALSTTKVHTISVRSLGASGYRSAPVTVGTKPSSVSLTATRSGGKVTFIGVLKRAGTPFPGQKVWIERKSGTTWVAAGSATTKVSTGRYYLVYSRTTVASYRVRFAGAPGITGSFSPTRKA